MEPPAGIAQDGYAECVRLNTVHPTMNRMPDAECETEVFNGFRLGGSHRVAVYKPILVSSTGPCKAFQAVYRWGVNKSKYGIPQKPTTGRDW